MEPPWKSSPFQLALSVIIALVGTGFEMTGSNLVGVLLIAGGLGWLWWLILPYLTNKYIHTEQQCRKVLLLAGWITTGALCSLYGMWIYDTPSATGPQINVSSTHQRGGITAGSITTDRIIINPPSPKTTPEITLEKTIEANTKTEEGYKTVVILGIRPPLPVNSLSLTVHGKHVKRVELSPEGDSAFSADPPEQGEGYAFAKIYNVSGRVRYTLISSEPVIRTNPVYIDYKIE